MRGGIELTQGAVIYLVLALVTILIGIMIVTKGHFTILFEEQRLSKLFGPGKVSLIGGTVSAVCPGFGTSGASYMIEINNAQITVDDIEKREGDTFEFYLLLDIRDRVFIGKNADNNKVFSCRKAGKRFDCPKKIIFDDVFVPNPSTEELLHITAWRRTDGFDDYLDGNPNDFADVINNQARAYLASLDLKGEIRLEGLCKPCEDMTIIECRNSLRCYYTTTCNACSGATSCSAYDGNPNACGQCEWPKANCRRDTALIGGPDGLLLDTCVPR